MLPDQGHQDSPARLIRGHMLDSVFVHMVDNKLQQLLPMTHNLGWANYKLQQLTPLFLPKTKHTVCCQTKDTRTHRLG